MSRQDFTKEIPREERKLDILARFITGHSVCAAVIFQKLPDGNSKLIISSNKMSNDDALLLDKYFNKDIDSIAPKKKENKELSDNLSLLTKIKNEGSYDTKEIQEELKGIFGREFPGKIFRVFQNFIEKSVLNGEINEAIYKNLIDDDKSKYYEAIEHFYSNKAKFIEEAKSFPHENEFLPKFMEYVEEIYQRINHDVRQLVRIIKLDDDFANAIAKGHFTFAPPKDDNVNDKENNHAEMNIVHYLIEHNLFETWYVGVSKLCCFHCANDIAMINAHKGGLKLLVRGEHGVGFPAERIAPDFSKYLALKEESATESVAEFCIRLLLGKKTLEEYLARLEEDRNAQAFLQALMSDSDEELAAEIAAAGGAGVSSSRIIVQMTLIGENSHYANAGADAS